VPSNANTTLLRSKKEVEPSLTESELDATFGGQGEAATCAATPDGVCICPNQ
jgi:hypothetical protein